MADESQPTGAGTPLFPLPLLFGAAAIIAEMVRPPAPSPKRDASPDSSAQDSSSFCEQDPLRFSEQLSLAFGEQFANLVEHINDIEAYLKEHPAASQGVADALVTAVSQAEQMMAVRRLAEALENSFDAAPQEPVAGYAELKPHCELRNASVPYHLIFKIVGTLAQIATTRFPGIRSLHEARLDEHIKQLAEQAGEISIALETAGTPAEMVTKLGSQMGQAKGFNYRSRLQMLQALLLALAVHESELPPTVAVWDMAKGEFIGTAPELTETAAAEVPA